MVNSFASSHASILRVVYGKPGNVLLGGAKIRHGLVSSFGYGIQVLKLRLGLLTD